MVVKLFFPMYMCLKENGISTDYFPLIWFQFSGKILIVTHRICDRWALQIRHETRCSLLVARRPFCKFFQDCIRELQNFAGVHDDISVVRALHFLWVLKVVRLFSQSLDPWEWCFWILTIQFPPKYRQFLYLYFTFSFIVIYLLLLLLVSLFS